MKRALILCLFFLMSGISGHCATTYFPPLQSINDSTPIQEYNNNITSLPDPFVNSDNMNYSDINRIEQSLYGQTFDNQNISARLSRIEKSLFSTTYTNSSNAQRIDNIISNFNQINKYPNLSKNDLSRLESRILNQNFVQNNPQRRIERLEQQMFGAVQSGDLNSRLEALKLASKTYNRTNNYYPNTNIKTGWKGIAGNLGNSLLGGSMTGFTPPITPYYNTYANGYNNYNPLGSGYGMYKGYGVNRGLNGFSYGNSFSDYGSGAGVTILD